MVQLVRLELRVPVEMFSQIENLVERQNLATLSEGTRLLLREGLKQVLREATK